MIRAARISDAKDIHKLICAWADKGKMLHRSLSEIYEQIRDYCVYETEGRIVGTAALHVSWENIAELRSLSVDDGCEKKGVGRDLVEECLKEAKGLGVKQVFVLTYVSEFFHKFGFKDIDKATLPHKIWSDCVKCHLFPDCNELAVSLTLD